MDIKRLNELLRTAAPHGAFLLGAIHGKDGNAVSDELCERAAKCQTREQAEAIYREAFPGEELNA